MKGITSKTQQVNTEFVNYKSLVCHLINLSLCPEVVTVQHHRSNSNRTGEVISLDRFSGLACEISAGAGLLFKQLFTKAHLLFVWIHIYLPTYHMRCGKDTLLILLAHTCKPVSVSTVVVQHLLNLIILNVQCSKSRNIVLISTQKKTTTHSASQH